MRFPGRCAAIDSRTGKTRTSSSTTAGLFFVGLLCLLWAAGAARADGNKDHAPDFSKGALYGRVIDTTTNKPIPDATVALQNKDGKVVAWTKTDAQGQYAIAADTIQVLRLRPSHGAGLLAKICKGIGDVVTAPVKVAVGVVSHPEQTVKSAVSATIMGNPAPLADQVTNSLTDKAKSAPDRADKQAREAACKVVLGERQADPKSKKKTLCPGEVMMAVSVPGYKEAKGAAGAYWLEPPVEEKDKPKMGVQAWMETVKLAPAAAPADKKSEIAQEALLLADPHVEPALAPPGGKINLKVTLRHPSNFIPKVRLFAREKKKDTVVELTAKDSKTPDLYTGELTLDPRIPPGDTEIAIGVLRMEPLEVKLPKSKEDPLLRFAGQLDDFEPGKNFEYDPRIFACENRLDFTITVLDPKQATAPTTGAPVPAPPSKTGASVPPPPSKTGTSGK